MTKPKEVDVHKFEDAKSMKTIEAWAAELKVDPALFAVAKAITQGWGIGRECTHDTFTDAMKRAANLTFR